MVSGRDAAALDLFAVLATRWSAGLAKPDLIATEGKDHGATALQSQELLREIAAELDVPDDHIVAAYEDPAEWLLREANLPDNVTPENSKLKDPEERLRLATVFERGLTAPVGFVLPVQPWQARASKRVWQSERWRLRRGKVYLTPGDSALGYRLPLTALPHLTPAEYPYVNPQDPTIPRAELHEPTPLDPQRKSQPKASFVPATPVQPIQPQTITEIDSLVRTALTVEPRDGRLCVFMPPLTTLEDYLDLLHAAEAAALRLGLKIHIEGYAPPMIRA